MPELRLNALTKVFSAQRTPALDRVTLTAPSNMCTVILGPSGCGKTTLLRIVAGLESCTSGSYVCSADHQHVSQPTPSKSHTDTHRIAMVFQTPVLYRHMSARKNIALGARRSNEKESVTQRVNALARRMDITHVLNAKPAHMSMGERQRVALAKALASSPDVLLLDEPFASLDPHSRRAAQQLVRTLRDTITGLCNQSPTTTLPTTLPTTLFVTHDQHEAMTLAQHMVVMRAGRVHQEGTPEEIYTAPATLFVARFVGQPSMNVLVGTAESKGAHDLSFACAQSGTQTVRLPHSTKDAPRSQRAALCVRPNDVVIVQADQSDQQQTSECSDSVLLDARVTGTTNLGSHIDVQCKLEAAGNDAAFDPATNPAARDLSDVFLMGDTRTWTVSIPRIGAAYTSAVPMVGQAVLLRAPASSCHIFSLEDADCPRISAVSL